MSNNKFTKKIYYNLKGNEIIKRSECSSSLTVSETNKSKNKGSKHEMTKKTFVKLLLDSFSPKNIKPTNDYYNFINFQWLKQIKLTEQQKYLTQIDDFRLTQDKVYGHLNEIIVKYIKENDNKFARNMNNYYQSILKMNSPSSSRILSKQLVSDVNAMCQENNPWKMLAYFNKHRYCKFRCPFEFEIAPDPKKSSIFCMHIDPHQFDILDLDVYYDDGTNVSYKEKSRYEYKRFCKELFDAMLGKGHGYNTDSIYEIEVEMFNAFDCKGVVSTEYNKISKTDIKKIYGFEFEEFCKFLGFKKTPEYIITSSTEYLKCCTDLFLKNWNSEKWKAYWIYIKLSSYCRFTKDLERIYYNFFGKFQRGQSKLNESDVISSSLYMSLPYNKFLTERYVELYADPAKLNYVKILCNDLLEVFTKIVHKNKWLQPSTKKYALEKLKKLTFTIGYPDYLPDDPDLKYDKDTFIENVESISAYYTNLYINLEGSSVIDLPDVDWAQYPLKFIGNQAYIVNASYTPSKNGIYINLGYIQKPFVDLDERGIEYNLAHLGFTIGHEMSHSLDNWGSQYDANGNLNNWWTDRDKKKFDEIKKDVVRQYEEFAARDKIVFDAEIGLGEDMADISGLAICDNYLKQFQDNNNDIIPIRKQSYEVFYIYYAFQQKQKISKKSINAELKTNPHPLDKYRCNIPLSRSQIFRGLYDVKKGDKMWWHNTDTIW